MTEATALQTDPTTSDEIIPIELAQSILSEYFIDRPPTPRRGKLIDSTQIIEAAAEYFALPPQFLTGQKRDKKIVHARSVAMYLCREPTEQS